MKIKNKKYNTTKSFYFEEYQQFSKNSANQKFSINPDRIYLLFFIFFFINFNICNKNFINFFSESNW
tara:strand:- start:116 stop:316 length:201 start_codon:yes stop_codon:yes gene_type:complete